MDSRGSRAPSPGGIPGRVPQRFWLGGALCAALSVLTGSGQVPLSAEEMLALSVRTLRRALAEGPEEARLCAAAGLAVLRKPAGVSLLEEALGHPDRQVRGLAEKSLRELGEPAALAALERDLEARAWRLRREALRDLARIAGPEAIPTLRRFLRSRNQPASVRAAAADGLGFLRDKGSADPLLELLAAPQRTLREHCLLALGEIRSRKAVGRLKEFLEETEDPHERSLAARALALLDQPEGISPMESALVSPNPRLRAMARDTLLRRDRTSALGMFRRALRHGGSPARVETILALAREADRRSIPALRELLDSGAPYEREVAAAALARLGDTSGYPILREILLDSKWRAGDPVHGLLAEVEDPSVAGLLAEVFRKGGLPDRVWAATSLVRFRAPFAERFLERVARDRDSPYRRSAAAALARLGSRVGLETVREWLDEPCPSAPNPVVPLLLEAPRTEATAFLEESFPLATGLEQVNIALAVLGILEETPGPR